MARVGPIVLIAWLGWILTTDGDVAWAQDVTMAVEHLATQIARGVVKEKQLRVVVSDFPDLHGVTSDFGRFIASRLTTRLAQFPKFLVFERERLRQVLTELNFTMSDLVDPEKAIPLGRKVSVEAIVLGTIYDLCHRVDIDARLIEIATNRSLGGALTTISKDRFVKGMLERGRQETGPPPPVLGAPLPKAPAKPESLKRSRESSHRREEQAVRCS
jgi:TolB-like protein